MAEVQSKFAPYFSICNVMRCTGKAHKKDLAKLELARGYRREPSIDNVGGFLKDGANHFGEIGIDLPSVHLTPILWEGGVTHLNSIVAPVGRSPSSERISIVHNDLGSKLGVNFTIVDKEAGFYPKLAQQFKCAIVFGVFTPCFGSITHIEEPQIKKIKTGVLQNYSEVRWCVAGVVFSRYGCSS